MSTIGFASMRGVRADESQVYKNRKNGFQFEICGDGQVEPALQDKVQSAFGDTGVGREMADFTAFVRRNAQLAEKSKPAPEAVMLQGEALKKMQDSTFGQLQAAADHCLGEEWQVSRDGSSLNFYGGINYVAFERDRDGVKQEIRLEHKYRDQTIEAHFSTRAGLSGATVDQDIQWLADSRGRVVADSMSESAQFHFAG